MSTPSDLPPASRPAIDLPTLDAERMDMLRELCTDAGPEMLHEMIDSWETEAARHLANARKTLAAADAQALKIGAHTLKGSCANMGIVRLAELSRRLEGEAGAPVEAAARLDEMQAEYDQARTLLSQISA